MGAAAENVKAHGEAQNRTISIFDGHEVADRGERKMSRSLKMVLIRFRNNAPGGIGIAANNDRRADLAAAINVAAPEGQAPEWIELIPAGRVSGRDGRKWNNDRPDTIVAAFNANGADLVIDVEHATEHKAPGGDPAPAVGWIGALENRGGAIWGRAEWTQSGRAAIENREYRYISPVFLFEKKTSRITQLLSAGLTNMPNLRLAALNQQQKEDNQMWEKLLELLNLDKGATEEQAENAVKKLQGDLQTAQNRAETPSLDKFVPRADYDAALALAANAEQTLADRQTAELDKTIDAEVDAALKAGKITPATADYHKANCRVEGGLERFREYVKTAPVIGDPSGLENKQPPAGDKALNAEESKIAEMFGNSAEDLKKYGGQ